VQNSDISNWELWCHYEELKKTKELELWWEERLLEAATKSDYFLRLEDDVLVNEHIEENVKNWKALERDDFVLGSLFVLKGAAFRRFKTEDGQIYTKAVHQLLGQGIVFKSSLVPELVEKIREARRGPLYFRHNLVDFDTVVARAAHLMEKKIFVHDPCLVDGAVGNGKSALPRDHIDFRSEGFDLHWIAA